MSQVIATKKHFSPLVSPLGALGFTLIELLVVMAVIGILAALSINSYQSSQIKARDAQRKNDLEQISHALEAYYNDYEEYPDSDASHRLVACGAGPVACDWGDEWSDSNGTVYMVELPADPRAYLNYYYESDNDSFQLYARLENNQDGDIPTVVDEPAHYGILCDTDSSYFCNYGVASTNTKPSTERTISAE